MSQKLTAIPSVTRSLTAARLVAPVRADAEDFVNGGSHDPEG